MSIENSLPVEEQLPERPEILELDRSKLEEEIKEAYLEFGGVDDEIEKNFIESALHHADRIARVDNVTGVLFRVGMDNPFRPHFNLLTAFRSLKRNDQESTISFREVSSANAEFAEAIKDVGSFGSSIVQSGEDFDDFLEELLKEEAKERAGIKKESTGSEIADYIRELGCGYKTTLVLKFI